MKHHPEELMLVEYAAGSLSAGPCAAVTAHLSFCHSCQAHVDSLDNLGAAMLNHEAEDVKRGSLEEVMAAIDQLDDAADHRSRSAGDPIASKLPTCVRRLLPEEHLPWRNLTSGLKVAQIRVGESDWELALHRIDAGGKAPHHDHRGRELTVVLTGSFSDEEGVYQPGDFLLRDAGNQHRPLAAQHEDCICLSVLEAPIRLTGLKRLLNPFLGFNPA